MARVLSTAFLVALLAASASAFALTHGAKSELSPIYKTQVAPVFSPGITRGGIDFRLRKTDRLTVWMTRDGKRVATIVPGRTFPPGWVRLEFTGITPAGVTLPDGVYKPVVRLGRTHRTIAIPSEIRIDTREPAIETAHRVTTHISPDGDRHNDVYRVRYALNGPAKAILYVNDRKTVVTFRQRLQGTLTWNGKRNGKPVRPGLYTLKVSARDAAGNESKPFPFALVRVRYVELGRTRIIARPRTHFRIRVLTDTPVVSWSGLGGRHGESRSHTLRLRAPAKPGVYRLYVTAAGHGKKATVVVA